MIHVKALGNSAAEILIYESIGKDWFSGDGVTAKHLADDLKAFGQVSDIRVRINSEGGNVFDGIAIYNLLKSHPAQVHVMIDGMALSIASVIAMAGDLITMADNAILMIHDPWTSTTGNAEQMRGCADVLDKIKEAMLTSYASRSGQSPEAIAQMMSVETWLTAADARDLNFADDITEALPITARFDPSRFRNVPKAIFQSAFVRRTTEEVTPMSTPAPASVPATDIEAVKAAAKEEVTRAEQARRSEIKAVFAGRLATEHRELLFECLDDMAVKPADASQRLLAKLGEGVSALAKPNLDLVRDEADKLREAGTAWLLARSGFVAKGSAPIVVTDNPFRGSSLMDVAKTCLQRAGLAVTGKTKSQIVASAITHSTSDFSVILENTLNKTLLNAYATAPDTWRQFCKVGDLSDFRAHNRYRLGSIADLEVVSENGEFRQGSLRDAEKETITGQTKGKLINLSRQMIINDDLGAFTDIATKLGRASARSIENDVYALFALSAGSGPTMGDTHSLFDAINHHNVVATPAVITVDSVEAMRVLMGSQQEPGGNDFVSLSPSILLCPLSMGGTARVVNEAQYDVTVTSKFQVPNRVRGLFSAIVDTPRLSGTAWYVLANPADEPVFEVAFLDGQQQPYVEQQLGFEVDGLTWKIRLDWGVAGIGWRGIVKNPGI